MIRACLFDLGNVILKFSHERMCAQMAAVCGLPPGTVHQTIFASGMVEPWDRGDIHEEVIYRQLEQAAGHSIDLPALSAAAGDIFELDERLPTILEQLRRQGYRLVLLSNTNAVHVRWIRAHFHIFEQFDELVLSYEVRAIKPEPAIFIQACHRAGHPPHACFYTDDVLQYVERARALGIDAEQFIDADTLVAQLARRGIRVEC